MGFSSSIFQAETELQENHSMLMADEKSLFSALTEYDWKAVLLAFSKLLGAIEQFDTALDMCK